MHLIKMMKNNKLIKNLSWILFGSIIHAILSFVLSVFAARLFPTTTYGILSYALSLTSLFSSFCTLGLSVIITKEIADGENSAGSILASGISLRLIVGILSISCMMVFLLIKKTNAFSITINAIYSLGILFSAFDLFMYWFRYDYKSNIAAVLKLIALSFSAILKCIAIYGGNAIIFAIGAILESFLYGLLLWILYLHQRGNDLHPTFELSRKLFRIAKPFVFSSILVAIYSQTDKIMLEAITGYDSVAQYSVCYTLANVVAIALSSLSEAYRPEILKARTTDNSMYIRLYKQLYGLIFWISILYGLFITLFRKYILLFLYGDKYLSSQMALSFIVWYSSFSYFGAVHNIYMVAENKTKWVQIMTLIGTIVNIGLNSILIPVMGAAGAAFASLLTQFVANFIFPLIVPQLRPMAHLTIQGIFSIKEIVKGIRT